MKSQHKGLSIAIDFVMVKVLSHPFSLLLNEVGCTALGSVQPDLGHLVGHGVTEQTASGQTHLLES